MHKTQLASQIFLSWSCVLMSILYQFRRCTSWSRFLFINWLVGSRSDGSIWSSTFAWHGFLATVCMNTVCIFSGYSSLLGAVLSFVFFLHWSSISWSSFRRIFLCLLSCSVCRLHSVHICMCFRNLLVFHECCYCHVREGVSSTRLVAPLL